MWTEAWAARREPCLQTFSLVCGQSWICTPPPGSKPFNSKGGDQASKVNFPFDPQLKLSLKDFGV